MDGFDMESVSLSAAQVVADMEEIASVTIDHRDQKMFIDVVLRNGKSVVFNVTEAIACSNYTTWEMKFRMLIGLHLSG